MIIVPSAHCEQIGKASYRPNRSGRKRPPVAACTEGGQATGQSGPRASGTRVNCPQSTAADCTWATGAT